jgi:redox-sensing transcriptional repressor
VAELGAEGFEEIEIDGDSALEARYREWLPVVEIGGERTFVYFVDPAALRRKVAQSQDLAVPRPALERGWQNRGGVTNSGGSVAERLTVGVAARLSRYLQVLTQAKKMGMDRISSQEIADYTNINATQIRRDLSAFGKFGKRGVGYNIDSLLGEIRLILRTQGQHNIALVGAGRLGQAIASSPIFGEHGINIAAVFDVDPDKVGRPIGTLSVTDYAELDRIVREKNIIVGVIAVPGGEAQRVANDLVHSGVRILFNYSEALLDVPSDVQVHTSNPAVELLHALYFHLT